MQMPIVIPQAPPKPPPPSSRQSGFSRVVSVINQKQAVDGNKSEDWIDYDVRGLVNVDLWIKPRGRTDIKLDAHWGGTLDPNYPNSAVKIAGMAVGAKPLDQPDRADRLNNLANSLGRRYERTGSMYDLHRAVEVASIVVDTTPEDHPDRGSWLSNLGKWLCIRYERTGSMYDLNRAEASTLAGDPTG